MACPYFGGQYCGRYDDLKCPYSIHVCGRETSYDTTLCGIIPFDEDFKSPKLPKLPEKPKQYTYKYFE